MKTFSKITGYVQNKSNGCAFVQSAAADDIIFVQPEMGKDLEVGATVVLDAAESWDAKRQKDGLKAIHIYSVEPPVKSTAFANVKSFNEDKMCGSATIAQGDYNNRAVHLPASVIEAAGFTKKNMPGVGQPCRIVFTVLNNGAGLTIKVESLEAGSAVSAAMKLALGDKPTLKVVTSDDQGAAGKPTDVADAA